MYSTHDSDTITIQLKDGKPKYHNKEVVLSDYSSRLLRGKGNGGSITIRKSALKYKKDAKNH